MDYCQCEICVSACKSDPGRLIPEDLPRIAGHLSISLSELLAGYLVLIPRRWKGQQICAPAPLKRKGFKADRLIAESGSIVPDYYEKENGRCIFLDDANLCTIHAVKPYECAAYMGCRHTFLGRFYRRNEVDTFFISKWKKKQQLLQIKSEKTSKKFKSK